MTTITDTAPTTTVRSEMRQRNPAAVLPKAFSGIGQLLTAVGEGGVPRTTLELVGLRVSQINGCTACVQGHVEDARAAGASDEQIIDGRRRGSSRRTSTRTSASRSPSPTPSPAWPTGRTTPCPTTCGRR